MSRCFQVESLDASGLEQMMTEIDDAGGCSNMDRDTWDAIIDRVSTDVSGQYVNTITTNLCDPHVHVPVFFQQNVHL